MFWAKNRRVVFLYSLWSFNSSDCINDKRSENASLFMRRLNLLPVTGRDECFYILGASGFLYERKVLFTNTSSVADNVVDMILPTFHLLSTFHCESGIIIAHIIGKEAEAQRD